MNIILGKDGKLSVNESPLQGKEAETLENVLALIENPSDGDAIVYDASAGIWKAGAVSGGGGSSGGGALIVTATTAGKTTTLDKTYAEIYGALKTAGAFVVEDDEVYGATCNAITKAYNDSGTYTVESPFAEEYDGEVSMAINSFTTDSENGYPSYTLPF